MIQELGMRLPWGVICDRLGRARKLVGIQPYKKLCIELDNGEYIPQPYAIEDIKPYLRPLSSMTPEEQKEYDLFILQEPDEPIRFTNTIKFYLRKHFDFEGLILMGLALPAPEGMYVEKKEKK